MRGGRPSLGAAARTIDNSAWESGGATCESADSARETGSSNIWLPSSAPGATGRDPGASAAAHGASGSGGGATGAGPEATGSGLEATGSDFGASDSAGVTPGSDYRASGSVGGAWDSEQGATGAAGGASDPSRQALEWNRELLEWCRQGSARDSRRSARQPPRGGWGGGRRRPAGGTTVARATSYATRGPRARTAARKLCGAPERGPVHSIITSAMLVVAGECDPRPGDQRVPP